MGKMKRKPIDTAPNSTQEAPRFPITRTNAPKPINLALQGGGAHGSFTWGVLDQLLQEDRIKIEAISGTTATSKFTADWEFLTLLCDLGKKAASVWLENNYDSIGKESSVNLRVLSM